MLVKCYPERVHADKEVVAKLWPWHTSSSTRRLLHAALAERRHLANIEALIGTVAAPLIVEFGCLVIANQIIVHVADATEFYGGTANRLTGGRNIVSVDVQVRRCIAEEREGHNKFE